MDEDKQPIGSDQKQAETNTPQSTKGRVLTYNIVKPGNDTISKWLYIFIILGVLLPFPIGVAYLIYLAIKARWKLFFISLWSAQLFYITLMILTIAYVFIQSTISPSPGYIFMAFYVYMIFGPPLLVASFINLIGLPLYMIKRKPKNTKLILCVLSLFFSAPLVVYLVLILSSLNFF